MKKLRYLALLFFYLFQIKVAQSAHIGFNPKIVTEVVAQGFDSWDKLRNRSNLKNPTGLDYTLPSTILANGLPLLTRGYTFHEHLDDFKLINMNGRMYDPYLGQFLSADVMAEKYVSASPYAYCLNNPLKYIDLDGKEPGDVVIFFTGAAFGSSAGNTEVVQNLQNSIYKELKGGSSAFYRSQHEIISDRESQISDAYNEVIEARKINANGKILIYGYSYGGVLALELIRKLKSDGIDVNNVYLIDAANGGKSDNIDRIINSKAKGLNIFQENPDGLGSHGNSTTGNNNIKNVNLSKTSLKNSINHSNIDELTSKSVQKAIKKVLANTKQGERTKYEGEDLRKLFEDEK